MPELINLPYDTLECILEFLTINNIQTITNLILTSKFFRTTTNGLNICEYRAKNILCKEIFNKALTNKQSRSWIIELIICKSNLRDNINITKRRLIKGDGVIWKQAYFALCGAYQLKDDYFLYNSLEAITKIYLGQRPSTTYIVWNKHKEQKNYQQYFEAGLYMTIKIVLDEIQTPRIKWRLYKFVSCLNYILNRRFRRYRNTPGLYELIDNNLYDKVVDYYIKQKNMLSLEKQKEVSTLIFDNIDYNNIKTHYDNKTLNKCTVATLKKYIRTRSPCIHIPLSGNKSTLIDRINEHIKNFNN